MQSKSRLASLLVALSFAISACSSGSTIELAKPEAPPAPEKPSTQPKDPSKPNDPNNPDNGNGNNGGTTGPTNPDQPEPPAPGPVAARYRVVCEYKDLNTLTTILTTGRAVDGMVTLFLGHFSSGQKVTRDNANLTESRDVMLVPGAPADHLTMYFAAKKEIDFEKSGEHFYVADVDTLLRTGSTIDLGSVPSISSGAVSLASSMGLQATNYGSSDEGHFTLLPGSGGLKVYSRDRTKTYGTIGVDTSRTIYPKILEKEKLFTALVYDGGSFRPVVQQLNVTATSVSVAKTISTGGTRSALPIQRYGKTALAWAEAGSADSSITIAKLDLTTMKTTRATYKTSVSGAVIYPQAAVYNDDSGKPTIVVAVEKVATAGTFPHARGRIDYAKLQKLLFSAGGTSLSEGETIEYPQVAITRVTDNGRKGRFIVHSLFSTPGSEELLMTMDARYGFQIFKDRGGYLDSVGEDDCVNPVVVEETL